MPPLAPLPGYLMNLVRSLSGGCGLPEYYNDNRFANIIGGIAQYFDDITLGGWSAVAGDLDLVNNDGFQQGRATGRAVSTAQGVIEISIGVYMAASALAAMGPTAGAGGACALATGGTCLILAGGALTVEGTAVLGGTAVAGHGATTLALIKRNPINEGKNLRILQTGGNTLNNSTLDALGLTKEKGKYAIEALKKQYGIRNDFHWKIRSDGMVIDPHSGAEIDNLFITFHK